MENEEFVDREPEVIEAPHFDEAWTVLSARPVVPLKSHNISGTLKLIAAFIGAGLLGVVVALASIRSREMSASVTDAGLLAPSEPTPTSSEDSLATDQTSITPEVAAAPVAKTPSRLTEAAKHQSIKTPTSLEGIRSEVIDQNANQPQLADEWQERRPRRAGVRRHRREIDDLHHRDLMRIQEIFEGRRPKGQ